MRLNSFLIFVFCTLAGCSPQRKVGPHVSKEPTSVSSPLTVEPHELSEYLCKRLSRVPTRELMEVAKSSDCTLALAAAWEKVHRTVPKEPKPFSNPDRQELSRFVDFVGERTGFAIPPLWEKSVRSAGSHAYDNIRFSFPDASHSTNSDQDRGDARTTLEQQNKMWVITREDRRWSVPVDEQDSGWLDSATVEICRDKTFIAIYTWPPSDIPIYALDRESGKLLWSARLLSSRSMIAFGGMGIHVVELRASDHELAAFGISGDQAYVELMDIESGARRCAFSSNFLRDAVAP